MRQRFLTFAVFGLVLVAIAEWNLRSNRLAPLASLNDFWLEFCAGNAGEKIGTPGVTVVRIDGDYEPLRIGEDTPAAGDGTLSRLDFATILGFLGKMDTKAITFLPTPTFDESLVLNQTDIVPLKDAAMQLPRLLAAANVSNDGEKATDTAPIDFEPIQVEGSPEALLRFTRTVRHPDPQILANADPAFKAIESARGLLSEEELRVPLVAAFRDEVVPSIVLASVARHAGVDPSEIVVDLTPSPPVVKLGDYRTIPIEADGTFVVPQRAGVRRGMASRTMGAEGNPEKTLHFTSLTVDELAYTGEENDEVARRILASFQNKFRSLSENLVVIGFDRPGDRRIDTESGTMLSETLLLARAIATIQSGRFVDWWPNWARWIAILAIAAIAALLFRLSRAKLLASWVVAVLLYFGACVLIFRATLTWTPPFFAFALFGLILLIGIVMPAGSSKKSAPETNPDAEAG